MLLYVRLLLEYDINDGTKKNTIVHIITGKGDGIFADNSSVIPCRNRHIKYPANSTYRYACSKFTSVGARKFKTCRLQDDPPLPYIRSVTSVKIKMPDT